MTDSELDDALSRLTQPLTVGARLGILQDVAEYWNGPISGEDGIPEKELQYVAAPLPLRWWYLLAGRRPEFIGYQNHLCPPEKLKASDDGRVSFYWENQGVYEWATLIDGDDPPVWGRFNHVSTWTDEGLSLSEFLIGACLLEGIFHAPFGASAGTADEKARKGMLAPLREMGTSPWHWPGYPSRFYHGKGAFAFVAPYDPTEEQVYSIWIGARNREALAFLRDMDYEWDYESGIES